MAVSVAFQRGTGVGGAASSPMYSLSNQAVKTVAGTLTFDSSYPTGGESITDITGQFKEVFAVFFEDLSNRIVTFDKTNNKALVYTALGTEAANTSDQSSIAVRFLAIGY